MTDNDIIKALECCVKATKHSECSEYGCPALVEGTCLYEIRSDFPEYDEDVFKEQMIDVLDVINRQKAEISVKRKLLEKAEAEIERLQKHNTEMARKHYQDGKTEAIKEFVERLKERLYSIPTVYNSHFGRMIDNLVKEFTEGG